VGYFLDPSVFLFLYPGDVGGQRTLRPYWRNYFEQTDAIVWVVDSGDRMRTQDCREELHGLLLEDVSSNFFIISFVSTVVQRLAGRRSSFLLISKTFKDL
jgi:GTPase SAR1 family protein